MAAHPRCWQCVWDAHMAEKHPISRSKRRQIRREARRVVEARLTADVLTDAELAEVAAIGAQAIAETRADPKEGTQP